MTATPVTVLETLRLGALELRFHANGGNDTASVTAFELTVPPDAFVPEPHAHSVGDELVLGLEGALTYVADGRTYTLHAGESAFCPAGKVHHFRNDGKEPARAFVVITPGFISIEYFRELAAILGRGGRPSITELYAVAQRYGYILPNAAS